MQGACEDYTLTGKIIQSFALPCSSIVFEQEGSTWLASYCMISPLAIYSTGTKRESNFRPPRCIGMVAALLYFVLLLNVSDGEVSDVCFEPV